MRRAIAASAVLVAALVLPAAAEAGFASSRWSPTVRAHAPKKTTKRPAPKPPRLPAPKPPMPKPPAVRPPTPPAPKPPKPPAPDPFPQPKPLARVQVIAREFSLTLSRTTLPAGRVAIELDNFGEDPHDLRVERADDAATAFSFSLARPGSVTSKKVELGAGEWKLYCSLAGHEALGMSASLSVID